jgi:hypothetical protein
LPTSTSNDVLLTPRDELVAAAIKGSRNGGVTYTTTVDNVPGLIPAGSGGINHGLRLPSLFLKEIAHVCYQQELPLTALLSFSLA